MDKLRVGVIGAGFWGRNHVRVLHELQNVELKAVCDINRSRVEEMTKKYSIDGYTDSKDLLKRTDIDAVSICTWSTELAKEMIRALESGKHVFVEKPMAINPREAEEAIKLSENNDLYLMVGFIERFNPGVETVKKILDEGGVGDVVSTLSRRVSRWPERIGDVGVVKDMAIHELDLLCYLLSETPKTVYAKTGSLRHRLFEDHAQILLSFECGATAFIEVNWLTPYKIRELIITGSESMLSLDYITQKVILEKSSERKCLPNKWREPLLLELEHFISSILNKGALRTTGLDGLRALKIADAVLESSRKNEVIKIEWPY
ncbi:MAG: Gfo/Idh/MocA family oxidoreductase [Candidatus Bathyarchaeia archaeon]